MTVQYLIDSENVGDFWIPLLELPGDRTELVVFYTRNSPHMSYDSLIRLKESDRKVTFIRCYEGTNALDFQLVSELGYRICKNENGKFVIVTNDTGFDAAVKYWRRSRKSVKRITGKECRNIERRIREDLAEGRASAETDDPHGSRSVPGQTQAAAAVHAGEEKGLRAPSAAEQESRPSRPNLRDAEAASLPDPEELYSTEDELNTEPELFTEEEMDLSEEAEDFAGKEEEYSDEEDGLSGGEDVFFDEEDGLSDGEEDFSGEEEDFSDEEDGLSDGEDGFFDEDNGLSDGKDGFSGAEGLLDGSEEYPEDHYSEESFAELPFLEDPGDGQGDPEAYDPDPEDLHQDADDFSGDLRAAYFPDPEADPGEMDMGAAYEVYAAMEEGTAAGAEDAHLDPDAANETPTAAQTGSATEEIRAGEQEPSEPLMEEPKDEEPKKQEEQASEAPHRSKSRRSRSRRAKSAARKQETEAQSAAASADETDHRQDEHAGEPEQKDGSETSDDGQPAADTADGLPTDEEIARIVACIGADNLAELHNQLATFYGDKGKDIYLSIKNNARSFPTLKPDLSRKFAYYCEIIFARSDYSGEYPKDISEFLLSVREKLNNLNSLRYALQKQYGKEKGRRFYFILKPFAKTMYSM